MVTSENLSQVLGWYGKMPASGDFLYRKLPTDIMDWWHKWLEQGLIYSKTRFGAEESYFHAPIWNFAIPASNGSKYFQLGAIAPSRDRVGRIFPLLISLYLPADFYNAQLLDGASSFYCKIGEALRQAVSYGCPASDFEHILSSAVGTFSSMLSNSKQVAAPKVNSEDILSILNDGHSEDTFVDDYSDDSYNVWDGLSEFFNPEGLNSYWWTSNITGAPYKTYIHGGVPNNTLFNVLFLQA
ncbi:type VI secretion system-associated protein TagF [Taylorella asinigenitalis]|uniref:Protein phosphatase ImpM n=1 Tax=Taylorella asinigenitalis (strain MCE3) TaxID=1008459 RepID=G4QD63_TAYAM|nr:type VI secretion system-associated protein TagF [Taylorella asinigenitalis]AEP35880.1 Protein phosphatase ImpM [Taylorella asinigenitalis MCE3]